VSVILKVTADVDDETLSRWQQAARAHITNTMAVTENDFEKGEANGAHAALALTAHIARTLTAIRRPRR